MRPLNLMLATVAVAAVVWAPSAATAHASLRVSVPSDGAQLQTMPAKVSLTLTEPVQRPSFVTVTSPTGTRVNSDTVTVLDNTVTTDIDKPTTAGTYSMTYRIVSADEHTVSGTIDFEVLTPSAPPTPRAPAPTPSAPASQPTPQATPAGTSQTQVLPSSDDSSTGRDALTIVGFSVVAMAGLVLVLRAGLRSADADDDD